MQAVGAELQDAVSRNYKSIIMIKIFEYSKCSTCRKALTFLDKHGVSYEKIDIVDCPPTIAQLDEMLADQKGELKRLFNTSGQLYREMNISQRLATMSKKDALTLLSSHGKLVKRPFLIGAGTGLIGFSEDRWREVLGK